MLFDNKSTMLYDEKPSVSQINSAKELAPEIYSVASNSSYSTSSSSQLPSEWHLTKTKKTLLTSTLHITSSSGSEQHAVSTHCGHSGVTIHTTNDQASEPLITAKTYMKDLRVEMPRHNIDFKTKTHWRLTTHPRVEWDMLIGGVEEHFEWAHSKGQGWKLMRRNPVTGEEGVVAVWKFSYMSARLSGDFAFVGGRELGEAGEYVAAAVALAIGKMDRDLNMQYLAGTGA